MVLRRLTSFVGSRSIEKTLYMHFLCEARIAISPFHRWRKRHAEKSCLILFPSLQEYCKIKKTEETAFPSIYIGLKDKLSGIRKVITDSTLHLIQLLESYKEKLQEFSREGEELSRMVMRKEETWEGREKDPFQSHSLARPLMILISTLFYNCNLKEVNWPYCISISVTSFWGCRRLGFKWILCQPGVFSSRVCLVHGVCPGSQALDPPEDWGRVACFLGTPSQLDRCYSQLSDFLEEYDIRTQVSTVVQRKYRTSKPEPRTRDEFLQCKLWKVAPSDMLAAVGSFAKARTTISGRGFRFL